MTTPSTSLSPQQIAHVNETIAKWMGDNDRWKFVYQHENGSDERCGYRSFTEAEREWREDYHGPEYASPIKHYLNVPAFTSDLNATATAEAKLQVDGLMSKYRQKLLNVVHANEDLGMSSRIWLCVSASALDRAMALMRVIAPDWSAE